MTERAGRCGRDGKETERGQNTIRGGSDPIAPQNRGPIPSGFGGHSRLLLLEDAARVFGRVQESEQTFCDAVCNAPRIAKGEEALGTSESTIEATKNYNPSGPPGGRRQAQLGQVRRIHRRERFLRRERGAQAPVPKR